MLWAFQEVNSSQWRKGPPGQSSVTRLLCVGRWVGRHINCLDSWLAAPWLWGWCCNLWRNACHRCSHRWGKYCDSFSAWPSSVPMWGGHGSSPVAPVYKLRTGWVWLHHSWMPSMVVGHLYFSFLHHLQCQWSLAGSAPYTWQTAEVRQCSSSWCRLPMLTEPNRCIIAGSEMHEDFPEVLH